MKVIDARNDGRLHSLFAGLAGMHLNITAGLAGQAPGRLYADDATCPRTACLVSGDGYYLAGEVGNQGVLDAVNAALPRDTYFVLFCEPQRWADALDVVLKETYAVRAMRSYYTLDRPKIVDWRACLPKGFSTRRVDAALLAQGLGNRDQVLDGILDTWISVEAFLAHGFGFCLVHGADIVSWSLADYVSGDRCEIGIYTDGDYRRQGLGTLTAAANAAYAVAQGFSTVGWHCWSNNVGSSGVAENVGFEKSAEYAVYINHWAAENVSDMTADEFRAFAEDYEREFEAHPPANGYPHLVAATAWALARDRQGCFRHLHRAVDLGWLRGVEHLRAVWPEFFWNPHLDEMEEWQALLKRFEASGPATASK